MLLCVCWYQVILEWCKCSTYYYQIASKSTCLFICLRKMIYLCIYILACLLWNLIAWRGTSPQWVFILLCFQIIGVLRFNNDHNFFLYRIYFYTFMLDKKNDIHSYRLFWWTRSLENPRRRFSAHLSANSPLFSISWLFCEQKFCTWLYFF